MSRRKSTHVRQLVADSPTIVFSSGEESSPRSRSNRKQETVSKQTAANDGSLDAKDMNDGFIEEVEAPVQNNGPRRSMRHRSPNKRYSEGYVKSTRHKTREHDSEEDNSHAESATDDDDQIDDLVGKVKATALFEERMDVEGQKMYGFKTPRKRGSMSVLASSVHRTPTVATPTGRKSIGGRLVGTPKTPTTAGRGKSKVELVKTPHRVRTKLKKGN